MKDALKKISEFKDLSREEIVQVLEHMVDGDATDAQIGAFIMGMKMKGETPEEIEGAAGFFRSRATRVEIDDVENLVDTCGTGGDMSQTFNVSTTVAFVLAGAGIKVAKHGNRSVSSRSGSADLLEYLGARIDLGPDQVKSLIEEVGLGFMFAPMFHPAMKRVIGPRKEVGLRSIFNLLGPLSNPAGAKRQLLGVYADSLVQKVAFALKGMGLERAFVVHGKDGLDEVSISSSTRIAELKKGEVFVYEFEPEEVGIEKQPLDSIRVSSVDESSKMVLAVLKGEVSPAYHMVLLNSMFGIMVSGLTDDRMTALELAKESIHSGKAYEKLKTFVETSQRV